MDSDVTCGLLSADTERKIGLCPNAAVCILLQGRVEGEASRHLSCPDAVREVTACWAFVMFLHIDCTGCDLRRRPGLHCIYPTYSADNTK
jgi:hypothetical protein